MPFLFFVAAGSAGGGGGGGSVAGGDYDDGDCGAAVIAHFAFW